MTRRKWPVISEPNDAGAGSTLRYDAASDLWDGSPVDVQAFTADGTWTKPSAVYSWARIICIGGGGGGGSGRRGASGTHRVGGAGGGGGGVSVVEVPFASMAASYAVTVGAGGAGGAGTAVNGTDGTVGTDGGATYVGASADASICSAGGGKGGAGGKEANGFSHGGRGGYGTAPGQRGGDGNNFNGKPSPSAMMDDASGTSDAYVFSGGGAGAGGGGGGLASTDVAYNGGDGSTPGWAAARTAPVGAVSATSDAGAGDSAAAELHYQRTGQGGGGGAGGTGNTTMAQGGAGGLYGGGGGGSGAQNNSGTTKDGGAGADGYCIVVCY